MVAFDYETEQKNGSTVLNKVSLHIDWISQCLHPLIRIKGQLARLISSANQSIRNLKCEVNKASTVVSLTEEKAVGEGGWDGMTPLEAVLYHRKPRFGTEDVQDLYDRRPWSRKCGERRVPAKYLDV